MPLARGRSWHPVSGTTCRFSRTTIRTAGQGSTTMPLQSMEMSLPSQAASFLQPAQSSPARAIRVTPDGQPSSVRTSRWTEPAQVERPLRMQTTSPSSIGKCAVCPAEEFRLEVPPRASTMRTIPTTLTDRSKRQRSNRVSISRRRIHPFPHRTHARLPADGISTNVIDTGANLIAPGLIASPAIRGTVPSAPAFNSLPLSSTVWLKRSGEVRL